MSSKELKQLRVLWGIGIALMAVALILTFVHLLVLALVAAVIAIACYLYSLATAWRSIQQQMSEVEADEI